MIGVPRIFEKIYAKIFEQLKEGHVIKQKAFDEDNCLLPISR